MVYKYIEIYRYRAEPPRGSGGEGVPLRGLGRAKKYVKKWVFPGNVHLARRKTD